MGDELLQYRVVTRDGIEEVYASSASFTVSGDLVFEDEVRNFQKAYAKEHWLSVERIKGAN